MPALESIFHQGNQRLARDDQNTFSPKPTADRGDSTMTLP